MKRDWNKWDIWFIKMALYVSSIGAMVIYALDGAFSALALFLAIFAANCAFESYSQRVIWGRFKDG